MTADGNLAHAIAEWLPTARWSTVQPGRIDRITVPVAAPIAQGVRLALVDMTAAARTDRYVVPVDDAGEDAAALPALARWSGGAVAHEHVAVGGRRRAAERRCDDPTGEGRTLPCPCPGPDRPDRDSKPGDPRCRRAQPPMRRRVACGIAAPS